MKKILRYFLRTILVFFIMLGLLIIFMLNPEIAYARKFEYKQFRIYSKHECPKGFEKVMDQALHLVEQSELFDPNMKADIFLHDGNGAAVKFILKKAFGNAIAWGYHNNVFLNAPIDPSLTWLQMNGYNRQLGRTIAHELIHCYEAHKLGWLKARPLGNIALWKWEGYPEYVSYRSSVKSELQILLDAIGRYETEKNNENFNAAMVDVDEGPSIAGKDYFRFWIMVKYLMDVKHLKFAELIDPSVKEELIFPEMISWYNANRSTPPQ